LGECGRKFLHTLWGCGDNATSDRPDTGPADQWRQPEV